jgi:hypothetical protein
MKASKRKQKTKKNTRRYGRTKPAMPDSNLDNYIAGYNISGFVAYPDPETDELLNAYIRGFNI